MVHKGKVRYRRWDVGRPKHHFLQVAYRDNELVEAKLKPYKSHKNEKEIVRVFKK